MRRRAGGAGIERAICPAIALVLLLTLALAYFGRTWREGPSDYVNLNTASPAQLASLFDIDMQLAERLAAYREHIGGFDSADQVLDAPLLLPAEIDRIPEVEMLYGRAYGKLSVPELAKQASIPLSVAVIVAPRLSDQPPTNSRMLRRIRLLDASDARPRLARAIVRTPADVARGFCLGAVLLELMILLAPPVLRHFGREFDPYLLPLSLLLSGLGVALLFAIKDPLRDHNVALHHLGGIVVGAVAAVAISRLGVPGRGRLRRYQYVWALAVFVLVGALAVFGSGPEGVKLNLFHFQPVELIKLLLVLFLAATISDRAELMVDAGNRWSPIPGIRRSNGRPWIAFDVPRLRDVGPLALMFVGALAMFYVIKDLGPGLLLFATFIAMLTLSTGRGRWGWIGAALIIAGGFIGYWRHVGVFPTRVDMWLHPFVNTHPNGMQLAQGYWGIASGGLEGSGLGLGMPDQIPRSGSDLAFVSWCEETGLAGAWTALLIYVVLVWRGIRIALHAANSFDRALAFGLSTLFGLQTLLIVGGVTGLFPLTGIALPFLSYGNSAMVADFALIGLLMAISADTTRISDARPQVINAARRFSMLYAAVLLIVIGLGRVAWMDGIAADAIAARPIVTPDADKIARGHRNPRLVAVDRAIGRGSIYDRNGHILATSRPEEIRAAVADPRNAQRLIDANVRVYPFGPLTAHVIGYMDPAVGGPTGLERTFDRELRGYGAEEELLKDYRNRDLPPPLRPERHGRDITLALDVELQRKAEHALVASMEGLRDASTGAPKRRGAFVILEPHTGDVLAEVSLPTYDPADPHPPTPGPPLTSTGQGVAERPTSNAQRPTPNAQP